MQSRLKKQSTSLCLTIIQGRKCVSGSNRRVASCSEMSPSSWRLPEGDHSKIPGPLWSLPATSSPERSRSEAPRAGASLSPCDGMIKRRPSTDFRRSGVVDGNAGTARSAGLVFREPDLRGMAGPFSSAVFGRWRSWVKHTRWPPTARGNSVHPTGPDRKTRVTASGTASLLRLEERP